MGGSSSWNGAPPSQGADLCHSVPGLVGFATRIGLSEGLYHSEGGLAGDSLGDCRKMVA